MLVVVAGEGDAVSVWMRQGGLSREPRVTAMLPAIRLWTGEGDAIATGRPSISS
jgi:hypothetical protein